jgi:para-nitrobenzyl esterase
MLAAALLLCPALAGAAAPAALVETGRLRGAEAGGVVSFLGIPFAAPPVGPLRWRAPQPAAAWSGVREATHYGADCMQKPFPEDAAPLATTPSEDCLYLNVWKPASASGRLPVLVWIYGGGFVNGGSSPSTYTGAELARRGIMVVSFNYRLGRFGTFAHPALTRADADKGLLGNYAFMDQLAALNWLKLNIARFGGDPARVTIIGESAGGASVHFLLTSPHAQGLAARAVILSGGDPIAQRGLVPLALVEGAGVAFAQAKGIAPDDPAALEKLRALPPETVVSDLNLSTHGKPDGTASSPFPDGAIAASFGDAYAAGRFAHVPVMVGATSNDIGGPTGGMAAGARRVARLLAGQKVSVYYYRFSYVASSLGGKAGADHASDIPFFFHTEAIKSGGATTARDRRAGEAASAYLVNFVRTGDPNGPGLPHGPAYSPESEAMLDLSASGTAVPGPDPLAAKLGAP